MANPGPNITSTPLLDQDGMEFAPKAISAGDGKQVGQFPASRVGYWGSTPVAQPGSATGMAPAGNVHTPVVGAGATVHVDTTFDGSIGVAGYTIGDIVAALKTVGILGG